MYGFNNFHFLSFSFGRFFILIKHISKSGFGKYVSTPCMVFFGHLSIFSFQYQLLESMIILLLKLTYFMFIYNMTRFTQYFIQYFLKTLKLDLSTIKMTYGFGSSKGGI